MIVASDNIVFCSQALLVVGLLSSTFPVEGGKVVFSRLKEAAKAVGIDVWEEMGMYAMSDVFGSKPLKVDWAMVKI